MNTKSLCVLLMPVAFGLAAPPAAALSVTSATVSVTPARSAGPCPVTFKFTGKVALNGKGSFTYKWERSDGATDTLVHPPVTFDGGRPALVSETWSLGAAMPAFHPFHGWVKLHILTPEDKLSDPAAFTLDCGGGNPTGGPPKTGCNGKPDLVPALHTPMDGWVAVKNIGTGNANASRVIIRCHKEGHTGPGGGCVDVPASLITPPFFPAADGLGMNVPALACGAEFTATMPWWANMNWPKGKYDFTATADFTFLVAESNEANNTTTSTLVK
jgi:CARDB